MVDDVVLMMGIEPMNLILTKDALYRLSYISAMPPRWGNEPYYTSQWRALQ